MQYWETILLGIWTPSVINCCVLVQVCKSFCWFVDLELKADLGSTTG